MSTCNTSDSRICEITDEEAFEFTARTIPLIEKKIILIRHAESEFNRNGIKEKNSKLTDYGRDSSEYLNFNVDLVVCSSMRRARETLDNSKIVYKDIIFTDMCREFLDGNPVNYYNGEEIEVETKEELSKRIRSFKNMLIELSKSCDTICVITHYSFLKEMSGFSFNNGHYLNYSIDELY